MQDLVVLVLGSGGREHALGTRLAASPHVARVIVAPGNGGTERELENAPLQRLDDAAEVVALARALAPDLVVVGPEGPLVAGIADALRGAGFAVFGPGRAGARLEGSKAFFKDFARRHGLPTATSWTTSDPEEAHAIVRERGAPLVVKADGLCAGKGVVVATSCEETHAAIDRMLGDRAFGDASATIVLEELLEGEEASVHVVTDGRGYVILPAVQDHKRARDGDLGPNTGGMGTYAPAPIVDDAVKDRIEQEIVRRTLIGLAEDEIPFVGVLFAGLMISPDGAPKLLEYNVRFGDPETEVLMAVLVDDLAELLLSTAKGELHRADEADAEGAAACVVMAAEGYPGTPRVGDVIEGLDAASEQEGVYVLHAGTRREGERVYTSGGRVLGVTASGETLREAVDRAYAGVRAISFRGMQYRTDIGAKGLRPPRR